MSRLWKWVVFLMGLAAVSRFLQYKSGPGLIDKLSQTLGNLFSSTIQG